MIVALRIGYRYELEWLEGLMVEHVERLLQGLAIYVEPSLDFVPSIYAPLYYYVSAAFANLMGLGFLPLRLVTLLSTVGTLLLIYRWVHRETGIKRFGYFAAGLYAASFRVCGAWFDIARGDALFLFLLLAGFYLYRTRNSTFSHILSALCLAAAFFTKQSALLATLPLLVVAVWQLRIRAIPLLASYVILVGGGVLFLNTTTDGWFYYYCFTLPGAHEIAQAEILAFWWRDMGRYAFVALVLSSVWIVVLFRGRNLADALFWLALLSGLVGTAWFSRMHSGGYDNVLMPAFVGVAIVGAISLYRLSYSASHERKHYAPWLLVAGIAQFALLWYDPAAQIPTSKDREAGDLIVERIRKTEGEVWVPYHSYLAEMAGKRSYAHRMAIGDVTRADSTENNNWNLEMFEAVRTERFSVIFLDAAWNTDTVSQYYQNLGSPTKDNNFFYPITGLATRPRYWFVPK